MSPGEIVSRVKAAGLGGFVLSDHQSARNAPAAVECAKRAGVGFLPGLEVQTAEEVHTLCIFDTVEAALLMTDWVYEAMPKRVNDPETFGDQPVVTWDDDIVDMEWRILAMGCRRSIPETSAKVHELGGLYIAAHVDRPNYSVFSGLGAIPEGCFDAVELSRTADAQIWLPKVEGYALTRSSDAHNLDDVAKVWSEADISQFNVASLKEAFKNKKVSISPRLTVF